jgi:hypothetical protein
VYLSLSVSVCVCVGHVNMCVGVRACVSETVHEERERESLYNVWYRVIFKGCLDAKTRDSRFLPFSSFYQQCLSSANERLILYFMRVWVNTL